MDSSNLYVNNSCYAPDFDEKFHPRTVTLVKDKGGFGFTLRHFIVYPPTSINSDTTVPQENNEEPPLSLDQWKSDYRSKPMDTIFIREVKEGSPAHHAGLNKGDRIIAINNHPLTGKSYSDIVHLIRKCGQSLRLLVVPKEDDILQLYFATSAYQPVHREHKQHKYLVPSFRRSSDLTNNFYRTSAYGTYPGRRHNNSKHLPCEENPEKQLKCQTVDKRLCDSSQGKDPCIPSSVISYNYGNRHAREQSFRQSLSHATNNYPTECFSEDESHYRRSKDLGNRDLCVVEPPPKSKEAVANLYYNLCHNRSSSAFSFTSEDNLNYPIYLSDFEEEVHCDNSMAESGSVAATGEQSSKLTAYHFDGQRPNHHPVEENHSDRSLHCFSDSMTITPNSNTSDMGQSLELRPTCSTDYTNSHLNYEGHEDDACDVSDSPESQAINLVAQRRHQFESGDIYVESLGGRLSMYRSELSRMSRPNHAQIVSSRAAQFESKTQYPLESPIHDQLENSMVKSDTLLENIKEYSEDLQIMSSSCDASDQRNRNKLYSDDPSLLCDNSSSRSYMSESNEVDYGPVTAGVVHRRKTVPSSSDIDECHIVRRISYLRATAGDRINVESDLSEEDETSDTLSPNKEYRIQKLKSFFGEKTPKLKQALQPTDGDEQERSFEPNVDTTNEESKSIYGWVICKVVSLEGKRSSDRSWRHLWAILRHNILYMLRDRREPSKGTLAADEHVINVKYSIAKVANDYVKRKNVLRLMLFNGTEYLVQTESHGCMQEWLNALQIFAREIAELPEWLKNTSVLEKAAAYEQQIHTGKSKSSSQHHHFRKPVFRHRNPSEHSPSVKTRRASQGDELVLTKIGVLWRDRMVQGWKKVHGSHSSHKDASFGVKLENAPPGVTNEHVPLVVELCVQIVESRGLDIVGIYRVPGNNASVSVLTDMVNQGIDDMVLQDARWNDVNIVSSLLKAFFRKLPEPLLTSYLYPKFIQASKVEDPVKRLKTIKHVLYHLPVHYFATLRYLIYHLKKVVEHSVSNKMEARNLAIVFGPTLVRTTDNNMVTMVTDMSHQCYLIETMIAYAEWLFEDCGDLLPLEMSAQDKRKTHPPSNMQSTALLSNINKLDGLNEDTHEMFTSLYNTATRHLRHRHKKKDSSNNANKRSGIIADEIDILNTDDAEISMLSSKSATDSPTTNPAETENLLDISFGSCSSLISGSSKTKQRSLSKEHAPRNGFFPCSTSSPSAEDPGCSKGTNQEEEVVLHRYNELSALAQEKVKNFELETKALLRRDVQRPRVATGPAQVEWEQIEREWQKAKLELEQEDLLDHLADDPSYLSCLLNRGDISPAEEGLMDEAIDGKNPYALSASTSCVKDFLFSDTSSERQENARTPEPVPLVNTRSEKSVLKQEKSFFTPQRALASDETPRTKTGDTEMKSSISQPSLSTSERSAVTYVSSSSSLVSKLTAAAANTISEMQITKAVSESLPDQPLASVTEVSGDDLLTIQCDSSPRHVSLPS